MKNNSRVLSYFLAGFFFSYELQITSYELGFIARRMTNNSKVVSYFLAGFFSYELRFFHPIKQV